MARKYPPLHLLSIFEAAARLENFKAASEELFITPSAVSHQVKALEEFVGFELFQRKSRGVKLNKAGAMYLKYIQQGLQSFEQGTKKVVSKYSSPALKISTFSTLASHVVIPQLGHFQNAHPDVDIRIETSTDMTDLRYEDYDLALRIGRGSWPGVETKVLFELYITPVCSPEFASKYQLTSLEQVKDVPLIDLSSMDNIWQRWSKRIGIEEFESSEHLAFNNYDYAMRAAEQGLGLGLAMLPLENHAIRKGKLITPFDTLIKYDQDLCAVYRTEDKDKHDILCFLDWLQSSPHLAIL
jgi:LysR family glycine cleavage system transcriptional activator